MDKGFRDKIMLAGVSLAPNGLPVEFYGSKGDPTTGLTALRGHEDSFFRRLILYKLAIPFNHHIYSPLKNITHRILCRPVSHRQHGLSGRMLLGMVAALESLVGVCLVAVSVIILHNAASMRNQLIATSLLSLAFPYIVIFLSADAFRLFTLTATFWAVAVVFISANYGGRSNRE
ncbi:hypothetical protein CC78DRAFT_83572 [Lojkania enalia]|uniref:DUF6594 domain-containing protein n=1 Tax=Lojkania enalia TaxID=147567 RepID=A0A9P4K0K1_9PLEO|nr:hypothetical protein CC78DRAFT_83572 [Didymosphaeria enalia]